MPEIANARVQFKRMTRQQWQTSSYIAAEGEMVFETDTGFVKIGDGRNRYAQLRYLTGPQGERGPQGATGERGPAGRDGVVTFENLSQAQRNSLKGDKGERGEQGPPGQPGPRGADGARGAAGERGATGERGPAGPQGATGERGHSLTANVRIEGNYRNGVNSHLNIISDVYYDGVRLTSGYTVDFFYRGFGSDNWTSQLSREPDSNGKIAQFSSAQRSGGYLEVYIVVTHQGIKAAASTRLDNVQDGARGADGQRGPAGANGQPGQNIINQNGGQPLMYWYGVGTDYGALSNKNDNTIYDITWK